MADEAIALLDAGGVTALHDPTEGGLATGIRELALAAGCGATIDRNAVPVLPETSAIAGALGLDPLGCSPPAACSWPPQPDAVERLVGLGLDVTPIGQLTAGDRFLLRADGDERELPAYDSDETTRVLGN